MDKTLSVENQILLLSARRDVDPAAIEALVDDGALVHHGVNWDTLLAAARRHHLLPLLYERLAELDGSRVPPPVMARLRSAYYTNLLRNQRLGTELAEVIEALHREGVEAIVLKGGALAWTVYANPAQRPMADLDLMIRPGEMERASIVLHSLGFHLSSSMPTHLVPFLQHFGGGLEWQRSEGDKTTYLEMKHNLAGVIWFRTAYSVEPYALWAACRPLALDGTGAWQLSAEDTLIHLCLHPPLSHAYAIPLSGYVDMDRVITAAEGALSWSRLVERADRFRVKTAVYHGLQCAQRLLGTPVPPEVQAALKPGGLHLRVLRWLASMDQGAVLQEVIQRPGIVRRVLLYANLVDDIRGVGGLAHGILFPGDEWLVAHYSLQAWGQARRYRMVHPLRVARAFVRCLYGPLIVNSFD
jgi:hypothetical protein